MKMMKMMKMMMMMMMMTVAVKCTTSGGQGFFKDKHVSLREALKMYNIWRTKIFQM